MSLSPSHKDRVAIPHQPAPPAHWPEDCAEVYSHPWLRIFQCPVCKQGHEFKADELGPEIVGLACFGDGTSFVREEPAG